MLRASRYRTLGDAALPYFTLYEMDSMEVLASPGYRALLDEPTQWTRRMRPSFGDMLRIPCVVAESAAGVQAAALMSLELRAAPPLALGDALRQLRAARGVARVHCGLEDTAVAPLPWHGAAPAAAPSPRQLLLVEAACVDGLHALAGALPTELAALQPVVRLHRLLSVHDAPR